MPSSPGAFAEGSPFIMPDTSFGVTYSSDGGFTRSRNLWIELVTSGDGGPGLFWNWADIVSAKSSAFKLVS
ncbi:unnamed protein product [Macrosiphum euphorbiae]|uniref:Uncharacterized protein n=1 Tax=Macrosiphum euphorbiae TaxID=13131 RepID=A0AAV0W6D5_9HEMI|nr:unnamed protein product [Macrosiphum euphorbiae]